MSTKKWVLSVAPMLVLAVVLTACSSSGDDSGSTNASPAGNVVASSGSTSSSVNGAKGSPIEVGLICSCTGPYGANLTPAANTARAWANGVNDHGGIKGHPIEISYVDDKADPGASVTGAQQLISKKVSVILDDSYLDSTWAQAAATAKIPVVGGVFNLADYFSNPDFFPTGQTGNTLIESVAAVAKQAGATKLANLYCAEAPTCQQTVQLLEAGGQKHGVPQVYSAAVPATAANYTAQCLAAKQSGADAVFAVVSEATGRRLAEDCSRQGYNPIYIVEGTAYADSMAENPQLGKNLWATFPIMPYWSDAPAVQAMRDTVDKYYPGLRDDKGGVWSELAAQSWTAGLLIEKAVENSGVDAAGTVDNAAVLKGLTSVKNETLDGWTSPLTFAEGRPHPVNCFFTAKVVDGKPTLENGGKPTCLSAS